ncbi:MAG TPA: CAP domain-containing protein [Sphingomonadaceae bacterium]|nr:CAP domain-containing protein [Sphingomonadaceae bacterium]
MSIASKHRLTRTAAAMALGAASMMLTGNAGLRTNLDARLLAAHNRERSAAGIAPLAWNAQLAADAREFAAELAATNSFGHSAEDPDNPVGENLFAGTTGYYAPEAMVGAWVEEKQHYKPGIFPNNSKTGKLEDVGHYTQLMWRDTRTVGCAVVPGDDLEFLVCRYTQVGNVEGERPF